VCVWGGRCLSAEIVQCWGGVPSVVTPQPLSGPQVGTLVFRPVFPFKRFTFYQVLSQRDYYSVPLALVATVRGVPRWLAARRVLCSRQQQSSALGIRLPEREAHGLFRNMGRGASRLQCAIDMFLIL